MCFEKCEDMSTPASAMICIAMALTAVDMIPAEQASITSLFRCFAQPSAIWLRQALPVQTNRTLIFSFVCDIPLNI